MRSLEHQQQTLQLLYIHKQSATACGLHVYRSMFERLLLGCRRGEGGPDVAYVEQELARIVQQLAEIRGGSAGGSAGAAIPEGVPRAGVADGLRNIAAAAWAGDSGASQMTGVETAAHVCPHTDCRGRRESKEPWRWTHVRQQTPTESRLDVRPGCPHKQPSSCV